MTNLRPPHRAVPLDVPHGAGGGASTPAPQSCAPRRVSSRRGERARGVTQRHRRQGGSHTPTWAGQAGSAFSQPADPAAPGDTHPPTAAPGGGHRGGGGGRYRAEGNGEGGSGASGTGAEDSGAGDIGTAGNGAACAALAVRCPSGSARCRAPGAARAWSERPPPLPPPPPSFSSPRCGASVAPRCGSRCPGAGSGGRVCVCVRGVCVLGAPLAEPLRSAPCRTPGAAASRPPPLPGPRRARSPLPPSPRSLPRSLPAPARSLSGPAPPRGPGRAARRDPQSAGRLGGSRPRRTDYGSRQPARPRLALALTLRLPLPVSPPPPPLPPNRRSQRPGCVPTAPRRPALDPGPRCPGTPGPRRPAPTAHGGKRSGAGGLTSPPAVRTESPWKRSRDTPGGGGGAVRVGVCGLGGPATSCGGTAAGARRALTAPGGGQRAAAAAPLPAPRRRGEAAALPGTAAPGSAPAAPAAAGAVRGVPRRGGAAAQRGAPGAAVGRRRRALVEFGGVARARPGRRCARGRFGCGCRPVGCRAVAEEPSPGAARPPPPPCSGLPRCGSAGARPRLTGLRDAPPRSGPGGNC
ncbi:translation initiation factor IF-2-like [Serinus canaria]|uniref:translation initiation factor IF-2-like n=1 Tax=Serinus canaria TaxID=9135 RepID=UPI0021CCB38F|nr:translation initiation factor IF-2-like [Serinus canaria]